MNQKFFTFTFFNSNLEMETIIQFEFINPDDNLTQMGYGEDKDLNKFRSEMEEKYGIHNVSASEEDIFGFYSNEISQDNYLDVFDIWRNHFISLGYECTDIIKYDRKHV